MAVQLQSFTPSRETLAGSGSITPFSHTTPAGTDRVLIVSVSMNLFDGAPNPGMITAVSYGGVPLIPVGHEVADYQRTSFWLLVDPPLGAANVTGTFSLDAGTTAATVFVAHSFDGVDQVNPLSSFVGKSGGISIPVATLNVPAFAAHFVFAVISCRASFEKYVTDPDQTEAWVDSQPGSTAPYTIECSASYKIATGSSTSINYDNATPYFGQDEWSMFGIALRPAEGVVQYLKGSATFQMYGSGVLAGPKYLSGEMRSSLNGSGVLSSPWMSGTAAFSFTGSAASVKDAFLAMQTSFEMSGIAKLKQNDSWLLSGEAVFGLSGSGGYAIRKGIESNNDHHSLANRGVYFHSEIDAFIDSLLLLAHARQHSITSPSDHTSAATPGQMLKADASGLPVNATNTDTEVAFAVSHPTIAVPFFTGLASVSGTAWVEYSRAKLNLYDLFPGGYIFSACLYMTGGGVAAYAECRLYDVTSAAVVSTLSSVAGSTAPTIYESGTLTPDDALREYTIEVRRQAGTPANTGNARGVWGRAV